MPSAVPLYKITHSSPEIETVGDFLFQENSPAFMYYKMPERFLNIIGDDGLTNRQRIEQSYKTPEEKKFIGKDVDQLPLKVGTLIYLETSEINQTSFAIEGIEVVSTDDVAFKAAKLAELEADTGYRQILKPIQGQVKKGSFTDIFPNATVWIWCRGISSKNNDHELKGEFFDITPFIQSCTTNMGKNGGNFSINLPPLVCELDTESKWVLKRNSITQFKTNSGSTLQRQEYVSEGSLLDLESEIELVTNKFLFSNIIRPNDLVFIRFETLQLEQEQRYQDSKEYYIDKKNLANRIYDMIALVDNNRISINPSNNDVSINITGRDLSKLFIEDGTYFYALENSQGMLKFAGQSEGNNKLINRIFGDGALNFIGLYNFTSIEYIIKFIIQQLSNIEVVPSDLFSSYAYSRKLENGVVKEYDSRNKKFRVYDKNQYHFLPEQVKISPFPYTDGKFHLQPLTNTKLAPFNYNKPVKEELANGIWQIVKLVIDDSVSKRRLCDSSFSTAHGSLLNFIRSAAQEPLVEFYMDTYGDQYHLIVRKPPYDQKALVSLLEGKINTEYGTVESSPAIVDIEADEVLIESLNLNDNEVYSWYHFFPNGALLGDAKNVSLSYLGALYFEEYAKIYGSKPFQQSHPYIPYVPKSKAEEELDLYERQASMDMKYVVESTQYLPFTRKGVLTLNGDRRIKIGNVIRYKPTGEIFFVDAVQQNISINEHTIERTTTVHVSRGMVEQLIYGVHLQNENGVTRFVSYFNIIDTRLELNYKDVDQKITTRKKVGTKKVSKEVYSLMPTNGANSIFPNTEFIMPEMVVGKSYIDEFDKYPDNKQIFLGFINAITLKGYKVTITSGLRNSAKQAILKQINNLNAKAGKSKHEIGRAIDINIEDSRTGKYYRQKTSEEEWRATGIPEIANTLGLRWAGNNDGTFGTKDTAGYYIDRVHFEIMAEAVTELVEEDVYEEVTEIKKVKGLDREGMFKNFKVNKFAFNFFHKNLQFDPDYRKVRSRTAYNSDEEGSLQDVIIKTHMPTKM